LIEGGKNGRKIAGPSTVIDGREGETPRREYRKMVPGIKTNGMNGGPSADKEQGEKSQQHKR